MASRSPRRIAFVSCNETPWGGSEELWARAALALVGEGITVRVAKPRIDPSAPAIKALREAGVKLVDFARIWPLPDRIRDLAAWFARPALIGWQLLRLTLFLWRFRPGLIVLSQGGSWDGFYMHFVLKRFSVPYALICQKASDHYWPPDHLRPTVCDFIEGASHVFFVSEHNRRLLEQQVGAALASASVVRNPYLVDREAPLPWPGETGTTRLACVGRLFPMEKGQDILLRVLADPKWRERDVEVSFFGAGPCRDGLQGMARHLGCDKAHFRGHVADVSEIWASHHALVLPSRAEGLPLVLVEAMMAGRVAIVSTAGGSAEVVEDGRTAFLMQGFDEAGLDAAMERAWTVRDRWRGIGEAAAAAIRDSVPPDPAAALAATLRSLADTQAVSRTGAQ